MEYGVKIDSELGDKESLYLSVTHNGSTWTSIRICNPAVEIPFIIDVLKRHLMLVALNSESDVVLEGDVYHIEYVEAESIVLTRRCTEWEGKI